MLQPTASATLGTSRTSTPRDPGRPADAARKPTDDGFRRAVDARRDKPHHLADAPRRGATKPGAAHPEALLVRGDGALVVTGGASGPRPPAAKPADLAARAKPAAVSVALEQVRVGGAPGAARLHATLGEGRHAGVELRAVEQNGRVAIELVATTPAGERALRGELDGLREALAARGCEGVSVDVRSGEGDGRERRDAREEQGAVGAGDGRAAHGDDAADAVAADDDGIVL